MDQRLTLVERLGQLDAVHDDGLLEAERHRHGAREVLVVVVPLGREGEGARLEALPEQEDGLLAILRPILQLLTDLHVHAVAHVHDHLTPLRHDLLERQRGEVDGEPRADDE